MAYLKQVIPVRPKEPAFRFEFAKMHRSLSRGHHSLYLFVQAESHQKVAVDLLRQLVQEYPDRTEYHLELSKWLNAHGNALKFLGRWQEAEASYQGALQLAEKLVADAPTASEYAHQLALSYNAYSQLARESGRFAKAIDMSRTSIRLLTKLETDYPDQPRYWFPLPIFHRNLAEPLGYWNHDTDVRNAAREVGRLEQKLSRIPFAARTWEPPHERLRGAAERADRDQLLNELKEMENRHKEAGTIAQIDSSAPYVRWIAASGKARHALRLFEGGSKAESMQELAEAIAIARKLAEEYPDVPLFRMEYSSWWVEDCRHFQAEHSVGGGRDQVRKLMLDWITMQQKLANDYPKVPEFRFDLENKTTGLTIVLIKHNEPKEALHYFKLTQDQLKKLALDFPACPKYRRHYADSFETHVNVLRLLKSDVDPEEMICEGVRQWQMMIVDFPGVPEYRHRLAASFQMLGQNLNLNKKYKEAEDAYREMVRIDEQLIVENPKEAQFCLDLSRGYRSIGAMKEQQERYGEAIENYTQAITLLETAFKLNPRQRTWLTDLRVIARQRADIHLKTKNFAEYQSDSQRIKNLDDALDTPFLRLFRITERATKGETALALEEADDLFLNVDLTDLQWRDLAVFYTEISAKEKNAGQKEMLATRAIHSLRNAVDQGCSRSTMSEDPRFRPLAQREDFQILTQRK